MFRVLLDFQGFLIISPAHNVGLTWNEMDPIGIDSMSNDGVVGVFSERRRLVALVSPRPSF